MAVLGAQRWNEADEQYLRETMPRAADDVDKVARKLGRTRHAVRYRVRRYRGRDQHTWTPEEDRELLAVVVTPHTERHAGRSAFADIAHKLGVSPWTRPGVDITYSSARPDTRADSGRREGLVDPERGRHGPPRAPGRWPRSIRHVDRCRRLFWEELPRPCA